MTYLCYAMLSGLAIFGFYSACVSTEAEVGARESASRLTQAETRQISAIKSAVFWTRLTAHLENLEGRVWHQTRRKRLLDGMLQQLKQAARGAEAGPA